MFDTIFTIITASTTAMCVYEIKYFPPDKYVLSLNSGIRTFHFVWKAKTQPIPCNYNEFFKSFRYKCLQTYVGDWVLAMKLEAETVTGWMAAIYGIYYCKIELSQHEYMNDIQNCGYTTRVSLNDVLITTKLFIPSKNLSGIQFYRSFD